MLRRFHKCVYFESTGIQEVRNHLMDIEKFQFTAHFMHRFGKRWKTTIPTNESLLLGEIIEYCRNPLTNEIVKFIVACKTQHRKYDVYYVVSRSGKIITCWHRDKHLPAKDMLRGKEEIYERPNETAAQRKAREEKRKAWFSRNWNKSEEEIYA